MLNKAKLKLKVEQWIFKEIECSKCLLFEFRKLVHIMIIQLRSTKKDYYAKRWKPWRIIVCFPVFVLTRDLQRIWLASGVSGIISISVRY